MNTQSIKSDFHLITVIKTALIALIDFVRQVFRSEKTTEQPSLSLRCKGLDDWWPMINEVYDCDVLSDSV